jgi:copper(I)-binding protein
MNTVKESPMKYSARLILALLFTIMVGAHAHAQQRAQDTIVVEHPWARATPGGAKTGAAYMTLVNNGSTADRLVSATTPVAEKVQFHSASEENGTSRMREMRSVEVAPKGQVSFSPGTMHIMIVGLKKPLKEGDTLAMTLIFEKAGKVDVSVPVEKIGAMQPGPMMQDHSDTMGHTMKQ